MRSLIAASLLLALPSPSPEVRVAGAMRAVMREGNLRAAIFLDTLSRREHLFGLGPLDSLQGELLVEDGVCRKATVGPDSGMKVETGCDVNAPFFVYARVERWRPVPLPDSVRSLDRLEGFLARLPAADSVPFAFRIAGRVDSARIHVVDLPRGSRISGPEDAHKGQRDFVIRGTECRAVGFFSKRHQGVFTHHDSFLHAHLITAKGDRMGHLESADFGKGGLKLFLPR